MKISLVKFILLFLVFAFACTFFTPSVLNQPPDVFVPEEPVITWKGIAGIILSPVKIILLGPLVPFINWLHQDPDTPPPFFLFGFAIYWSLLAAVVHYVLRRWSHA